MFTYIISKSLQFVNDGHRWHKYPGYPCLSKGAFRSTSLHKSQNGWLTEWLNVQPRRILQPLGIVNSRPGNNRPLATMVSMLSSLWELLPAQHLRGLSSAPFAFSLQDSRCKVNCPVKLVLPAATAAKAGTRLSPLQVPRLR